MQRSRLASSTNGSSSIVEDILPAPGNRLGFRGGLVGTKTGNFIKQGADGRGGRSTILQPLNHELMNQHPHVPVAPMAKVIFHKSPVQLVVSYSSNELQIEGLPHLACQMRSHCQSPVCYEDPFRSDSSPLPRPSKNQSLTFDMRKPDACNYTFLGKSSAFENGRSASRRSPCSHLLDS